MTDELTKTFFDTFGIQAKPIYSGSKLYNPFVTGYDYPQITDRILLELICIAHTSFVIIFVSRDVEKLKEEVLTVLCHWVDCRVIKQKVRTLFEEW